MKHIVSREIGGRTLTIESGEIAKQAAGATIVRCGDCAVMCAVTWGEPRWGGDFFPLTVDYRENNYAAGKIPGGFFKREGRPTTKEILTARCIDRPVRPLFPDGYMKDVMVSAAVLSADRENDPDILAMIAASAALAISELPFQGPIGAVRVGRTNGELVVNPTHEQRDDGDIDLVVASTADAIVMVEAGAKEVAEADIIDALEKAHEVNSEVIDMINEFVQLAGKSKIEFVAPEVDEELKSKVHSMAYDKLRQVIRTDGKMERKAAMDAVCDEVVEQLCPEDEIEAGTCPEPKDVKSMLSGVKKEVERNLIIQDQVRSDGRGFTDIRDIDTQLQFLPRTHGSAVFTRGETQAIVTATLGTSFDEQRIDGLIDEKREKFMLHYNFPGYCVGESWPNRGPKRREIGHGALAERSIKAVLPDHDDFPYTIRVVSDITESNGSSSMASVCGGVLSLMDAGVPLKRPVAGIAMGLIEDGDNHFILSDILGSEDHNGDMDFKVAGTQNGITALQMDVKISGLSRDLMKRALEQAREGRLHILREMLKKLDRPRDEVSPLAPKIMRITIDPEKIGLVIGPGGKVIKGIQEATGATIEIEDSGTITIWGKDDESAQAAREQVEMITQDVEVGATYDGKVVSIKDFGCFVEVLPGQEGLVHVSELSGDFVDDVSSVVKRGDQLRVKVLESDPQGRLRLSHKAVLIDEGKLQPASGPDNDRGSRGGGGRGGDRDKRGGGGRDRGRDRGPRR
ncbi:MAG: polyribonucleotide nucleotidyltransferase [Planctomycetes bacterium]|nr:polyribonucleotide nucleotidyltransferase [Planctomycetota bacterium]